MSGTSPTDSAAVPADSAAESRTGTPDDPATGGRETADRDALRRRRYRDLTRQTVPLVILAGLVGSALIMIPDSFGYRAACVGVATTCLVAGVLRLVLPYSWVGVLAVRGRVLDAATYLAAAVGVVVLAFSVPLP